MMHRSTALSALLLVGIAAFARDDDRALVDNARDGSVIERGTILVRNGLRRRVTAAELTGRDRRSVRRERHRRRLTTSRKHGK